MKFCPNISLPQNKKLIAKIGLKEFYNQHYQEFFDISPEPVINKLFVDIDAFSIKQQNEVIDTIIYLIDQAKSEGITNVNDIFLYIRDIFNNQNIEFKEANSDGSLNEWVKIYNNIDDNWDKFVKFTKDKLVRLGVKVTSSKIDDQATSEPNEDIQNLQEVASEDPEVDTETFVLSESAYQRDNYSDNFVFSQSSKDTASSHLKLKLSTIVDVEYFDGKLQPKENFLGMESFMPLDKVWNTLLRELTPLEIDQIYPKLQELAKENPMYSEILNQIFSDPNTAIQNEFLVTFSQQQAKFITAKIGTIDNDGNYTISVFGTNRQNAEAIIIEDWIDNFKNSPLVSDVAGEYIIDTELAKKVLVRFDELISSNFTNDQLQNFFAGIGIDLSDKTIQNFRTYGIKESGNRNNTNIKDYLRLRVRLIFIRLAGGFIQTEDDLESKFDYNNPFISEATTINELAKLELKANPSLYESSFISGDGKSKYSYVKNSYISKLFKKLKGDRGMQLMKDLQSTSYASNSVWIRKYLNDSDFVETFDLEYFDTLGTSQSKQKGKLLKDMSSKEKEFARISLFQNQGRKGKAKYFGLIPSDKTTIPVITALKTNVVTNLDTLHVGRESLSDLYTGFVFEYNRISDVITQSKDSSVDQIEGYHKLTSADGKILPGMGFKFLIYDFLNGDKELFNSDGTLKVLDDVTLKSIVTPKIQSFISKSIKTQISTWKKLGIFKRVTKANKKTKIMQEVYASNPFDKSYKRQLGSFTTEQDYVKAFAADYVVNNFIAAMNYTQIIGGDPALHGKKSIEATWINYSKRLAKDIAPGLDGNFVNPYYNVLFLKDALYSSNHLAEYMDVIGSKAASYGNINTADAQEYTTLKEHLAVMDAYGKLNPEAKKAGQRLIEGGSLESDIDLILQPMKPVQVGFKIDKELGINRAYYIKTSSFPLIPSLTKGLEIDKLRVKMENGSIDRAVYESGVKLGLSGEINEQVVTLNRDIFRLQQEIPYHGESNYINEGSQARKLLLLDIEDNSEITLFDTQTTGKEAKQLYEALHVEKMNRAFDKLLTEIGVDKKTLKINDLTKLQKVLLDEAVSRGYNVNDIYGLQIETVDGLQRFKIPLGFNTSSSRLESILNALVTNRVIKQELPGFTKVQGASTGFSKITSLDQVNEVVQNSIIWVNPNDTELNYIRKSEDGKTLLQADILVPSWFKDENNNFVDVKSFIKEDGILDTEKLPESLLTIIGIRIPTQGLNSMMSFRVKGFLPKMVGDLAIVPAEIVAQMGSDFDVDKLFIYRYEYKYKDGKYIKVEAKFKTERITITRDFVNSLYKNQYREYTGPRTEEFELLSSTTYSPDIDEAFIKHSLESIASGKASEIQDTQLINPELALDFRKAAASILKKLEYGEIETGTAIKIDLKKSSEAQLNNAIIQFYEDRYKDVGLLSKILEPNGFGKLPELAQEIAYKLGLNNSDHFLLPSTQNQIHKNNNDGKGGTAIFSLFSTFIKAAQDAKLSLPHEIAVKFIVDDKLVSATSLYGSGIEQAPSTTISYFQSASVDNAKEQILGYLNINSQTMDVAGVMALLGFDEELIAYFMSQPVIREYVESISNINDITDTTYNVNKEAEALFVIEAKELGKIGKSPFDEDAVQILQEYSKKYLSIKDLKAELDESTDNQITVLQQFLAIKAIAKKIRAIQSAINTDTSGLGARFTNLQVKVAQIDLVKEKSPILGVNRLFENSIIGLSEDITRNSLQIFSQILPYETGEYKHLANAILEQQGKADREINTKDLDLIYGSIKSLIYSDNTLLNIDKINEIRESLLFNRGGNISLGDRWSKYIKSPAGKKNMLAERIKVRRGATKLDPVLLESINTPAAVKEDTNAAIADFYRMYYRGSELEKQLATDIIKYYILTGASSGLNSVGKYIPYDILEEYDFSNKLNDINDNLQSGSYRLQRGLEQFFQHQPSKAVGFDNSNEKITNKETENNILSLFTLEKNSMYEIPLFNDQGQKIYVYPTYLSTYNTEVKNFILYKIDTSDNERAKYIRIDTLGDGKTISEFSIKENQYSLITKNQSGNQIPLGQTQITKVEDNITYEVAKEPDLFDKLIDQLQLNNNNLETTLNTIIENPQSPEFENIAKDLKAILVNYPKVEIGLFNKIGVGGSYNNNKISINLKNIIDNNTNPLLKAQRTILHETLHAITVNKINDYDNLSKEDKSKVDAITSLYNKYRASMNQDELLKFEDLVNKYKENPESISEEDLEFIIQNKQKYYALVNIKEFIAAGLTDEAFVEELKNNNFWKDLWVSIVELLGLNKEFANDYEALYNTTINLGSVGNSTDEFYELSPESDASARREFVLQKAEFLKMFKTKIGNKHSEATIKKWQEFIRNHSKYTMIEISLWNGELRVGRKKDTYYDIDPVVREKTAEEKFVEITIKRLRDLRNKLKSSAKYKTDTIIQNKVSSISAEIKKLSEHGTAGMILSDIKNKLDTIQERLDNPGLMNIFDVEESERYLAFYQNIRKYIQFSEAFENLNRDLDYIVRKSEELIPQLKAKSSELLYSLLKERIRIDGVDVKQILTSPTKDVGTMESLVQSGAFSSSQIVQLLQELVEDTQLRTNEDFSQIEHGLTNLIELFLKKYKNYDIFIQKDAKGKPTGRLLNKFSQEYYDELTRLKGNKKAYAKFYKANTKIEITEEGAKEYEDNLNAIKEVYPNWNVKDTHDNQEYLVFLFDNDPYSVIKRINKGEFINLNKTAAGKYITRRPIDKWIDPNYTKLKSIDPSDPARMLYDILDAEFRQLNKKYENQVNYIPEVNKSLIGHMLKGNWRGGFGSIMSSIIDSTFKTIEPQFKSGDLDINGKPYDTIPVYMMSDILSPEQKSYDLGTILLSAKAQEIALAHKAEIEPYMLIMKQVIQDLPQYQTNESDQIQIGDDSKPLLDTSIGRNKNLNDQSNWIIEDFLYNKGTKQSNFSTTKKIKQTTVNTRGEIVTTEKVLSGSMIADTLGSITRLKGMGLNPFSGFGNLVFGILSNAIYSGDRKAFGEMEAIKAFGIMLHAATPKSAMNRKVGVLMKYFDVLKQTNEIKYGKFDLKSPENPLNNLSWYEFQKRGEYFVQGQTGMAMLLNKKIKNAAGKQVTYFDAFDNDGKWKPEFGENPFNDYQTRANFKKEIADTIGNVHGDYARGLKAKEHWIGRALLVFRTWLPQSVASRFGKEYKDLRGETIKGRYRSYELNHAFILPLIKDMFNAFNTLRSEDTVDTRNLRKNAIELAFIPVLWAAALFMKSLIKSGDDDDDEELLTFILNSTLKASNDLTFFMNPYSFKAVTKEPIPAFKTLMDAIDLGPAVFNSILGEGIYETGRRKGKSKLYKELIEVFPLINQPGKFATATSEVFDKD